MAVMRCMMVVVVVRRMMTVCYGRVITEYGPGMLSMRMKVDVGSAGAVGDKRGRRRPTAFVVSLGVALCEVWV